MFIKFVHYPAEGTDDKTHETVVECKDFSFHYDKGNWREGAFFIDSLAATHRVVLGLTRVYVMSESGKTIDSYKWIVDEENMNAKRM